MPPCRWSWSGGRTRNSRSTPTACGSGPSSPMARSPTPGRSTAWAAARWEMTKRGHRRPSTPSTLSPRSSHIAAKPENPSGNTWRSAKAMKSGSSWTKSGRRCARPWLAAWLPRGSCPADWAFRARPGSSIGKPSWRIPSSASSSCFRRMPSPLRRRTPRAASSSRRRRAARAACCRPCCATSRSGSTAPTRRSCTPWRPPA